MTLLFTVQFAPRYNRLPLSLQPYQLCGGPNGAPPWDFMEGLQSVNMASQRPVKELPWPSAATLECENSPLVMVMGEQTFALKRSGVSGCSSQ